MFNSTLRSVKSTQICCTEENYLSNKLALVTEILGISLSKLVPALDGSIISKHWKDFKRHLFEYSE